MRTRVWRRISFRYPAGSGKFKKAFLISVLRFFFLFPLCDGGRGGVVSLHVPGVLRGMGTG